MPDTRSQAAQQDVRRRYLVADDNRDAAATLALLLEIEGHVVTIAYSGRQALEVLFEGQIDVALIDIAMPDLTGHEVAEQIRRDPRGQSVVLIAVTGWAEDQARTDALAAGFDHYLAKPVSLDRLNELVPAP